MRLLSLSKWPGSGGDSSGGTGVTSADNGLSLFGPTVQLGQNVGELGSPAVFLSTREIPSAGFNLLLSGLGGFYIGDSDLNSSGNTSSMWTNPPKLIVAGGKPTISFNVVDDGSISGQPWGTGSIVWRSQNPNVPLIPASSGMWGDYAIAGLEFHYATATGTPSDTTSAYEFWQGYIDGTYGVSLGIYGKGIHFAGIRNSPSIEVPFCINIGQSWSSYSGFSTTSGSFNLDANNSHINIWNLPTTTNPIFWLTQDSSGAVSKSAVFLRYKESATPTTPNDYVATGEYAVVVGGETNSSLGINSVVLGGSNNTASGNNSFSIGDNSACIAGYGNQSLAVDSAIIGGNGNVISSGGVGSVIICAGENTITNWNSGTFACGFSTINSKNSAIIATGESSTGSLIAANAQDSAIIGGEFHTINGSMSVILGGYGTNTYSFGEVVIGQYNIPYTAASTSAWNISDRIFTIANGTAPGTEANILTTLKGGNIGAGITIPTATIHIKAGSATAGTAPIKLTAGSLLTTPEDGVFEYDGTHLYFTIGVTRHTII